MKIIERTKASRAESSGNVPLRYAPKTPFGKRLWALRKKCIAEGGALLDWDGLEQEVALRKGQTE